MRLGGPREVRARLRRSTASTTTSSGCSTTSSRPSGASTCATARRREGAQRRRRGLLRHHDARRAWVWDIYRPARFAKTVRVVTFQDVNVEELARASSNCPGQLLAPTGGAAARAVVGVIVHRAGRGAALSTGARMPLASPPAGGLARAHDESRTSARATRHREPRGQPPTPESVGLDVVGVPVSRSTLGRVGEDLAVRWLVDHGMQVVERNWRCEHGEVDIVALDGACLVICEVKARRSLAFGEPGRGGDPCQGGAPAPTGCGVHARPRHRCGPRAG